LLYRLAYSLGEAASVGVLEGGDVVCVAAVSAGRVVSATLQPGTRVPAYCTANGRVMLATLADAALEACLAALAPEALTEYTIVDPPGLLAEVRRVRAQGYALVNQELELGLRTLAVPLRNFKGETVAAMNVSISADRMQTGEVVERCLPQLLKVQSDLSAML
jgi:IclR family pca regulon transcriptional regulator